MKYWLLGVGLFVLFIGTMAAIHPSQPPVAAPVSIGIFLVLASLTLHYTDRNRR